MWSNKFCSRFESKGNYVSFCGISFGDYKEILPGLDGELGPSEVPGLGTGASRPVRINSGFVVPALGALAIWACGMLGADGRGSIKFGNVIPRFWQAPPISPAQHRVTGFQRVVPMLDQYRVECIGTDNQHK